jgi:diguanylate cyclase (GGDEF)-like protein/PAS domain S-box-containing protein
MSDDQQAKLGSPVLDAVLDALLEHDPPPHIAAIDALGFFVPMPPSVPVRAGYAIEGRTSAVQLVIAEDMPKVIEAWESALRVGASRENVRLLTNPSDPVSVHFIDARHRFGVMLGLIVGARAVSGGAKNAEAELRPRVWVAKKNKLAVFIDVDPAAVEILGWSREELIGHRSLEIIHPDDRSRAVANWLDTLSTESDGRRSRLRYRHRDGSWIWFECVNRNLLSDPTQQCVHTEMVNVNEEMAALDALRSREELLHRLAESLPLGILQIDAAGRVIYRNERLGTIVGNEHAETFEEQFAGVALADRATLAGVLRAVIEEGKDGELEIALARNGETCCCSIRLRALTSEKGGVSGAIVCVADVTEQTRMREELEYRATYDALTGCRNRESIFTALEETIRETSAKGSGSAVLFVDLDGFKEINDRWGHAVGDELLRRISTRLVVSARGSDLVGRFGGDEFLVVCPGVADVEQARAIAERIAGSLDARIEIGPVRIDPRASIGVAWTDGRLGPEALVAAADAAMYASKREALGRPVLHSVVA